MAITMLKDVTPRRKNLLVKVRVVSSWWLPGFGNNNPTFEVVLMNEQGDTIQASLRTTAIVDRYKTIVVDGVAVSIEHFSVGVNGSDNNRKYLITDHPYKIIFSPTTIVKKVDDFAGPLHGFKFVSFDRIASSDLKEDQTVDVIGCLKSLGEKTPFQKKGQTSFRLSTYLTDLESVQIKVTLFGTLSVSNAFNGTNLFVNDDVAEINDFLQRYDGQPTFDRVEAGSSQLALTNPADFFKDCDHIPLSHVTAHEKEAWYVTLATIDSIHQDEPWWYSACKKHNRKVFPLKEHEKFEGLLGNGMKCESCYPNPPSSLYPKFKVNVRVINDTGSITMTLFDKQVRSLIGMSAHDLRKRHLHDDHMVPEELEHIIGRRFLFKYDVDDYNIRQNFQFYTVAEFTDDEATIVCFKKAFHIEMDTLDPSDITQCQESVSEGMSAKDVGSVTGDNATTLDLITSTGDSPFGKRRAADIDNDPASVKSSSSKTKKRLIPVNLED